MNLNKPCPHTYLNETAIVMGRGEYWDSCNFKNCPMENYHMYFYCISNRHVSYCTLRLRFTLFQLSTIYEFIIWALLYSWSYSVYIASSYPYGYQISELLSINVWVGLSNWSLLRYYYIYLCYYNKRHNHKTVDLSWRHYLVYKTLRWSHIILCTDSLYRDNRQ